MKLSLQLVVMVIAGATMGTGIPFVVFPLGSANTFATALGIPSDMEGACNHLMSSNIRVIDGATYNGKPMVLLAGVGFEASRGLKHVVGPLAYVMGGMKHMLEHNTFHCKVELDGETLEIDTVAITIANVAPQHHKALVVK